MSVVESRRSQSFLFRIALGLGAASMTVALGVFAYLGTFTRYLADDYCETVLARTGLIQSLIQRYETISDRYSNLLFVGLSEFLLPHNVEILPVIMILLWTVALTWLVYEARRALALPGFFGVDFFLGASLAFFSILQAPNRFQTIYWRSAMATHFAPLVFLTALAAFLFMWIRRNEGRAPAVWIGLLCLIIAFFGGGFSEPPDALLIVTSLFALAATWLWERGSRRRPALMLLSWTCAGGLLALVVLMASPGNSFRIRTARPDLLILGYKTFLATLEFVLDSFSILPLPSIVSIAIPLLLWYSLFAAAPALSSARRRVLFYVAAAIPILGYGLIAASFAPSVYGQAFPAERARFIGRLLMTAALMSEGACLGSLLAQWRVRWLPISSTLAMIFFALSAVYPLRAAWTVLQDKEPYYRTWSSVWDRRQEQIMTDKSKGVEDVVSFQIYSIEGIGELGADPKSWINVCAAHFYGVHSISAP
ncbi:MAG TPA: DUF6056 family protein [Anaerolineales bacterium]|nr:DUF6056 family protein [Anaerolineales bacterium]